jgi:hypothetical protein
MALGKRDTSILTVPAQETCFVARRERPHFFPLLRLLFLFVILVEPFTVLIFGREPMGLLGHTMGAVHLLNMRQATAIKKG